MQFTALRYQLITINQFKLSKLYMCRNTFTYMCQTWSLLLTQDMIHIYVFLLGGFGGPPDPIRTRLPGPGIDPKGRERGLPAIPNNSRVDTKSKNDS